MCDSFVDKLLDRLPPLTLEVAAVVRLHVGQKAGRGNPGLSKPAQSQEKKPASSISVRTGPNCLNVDSLSVGMSWWIDAKRSGNRVDSRRFHFRNVYRRRFSLRNLLCLFCLPATTQRFVFTVRQRLMSRM